MSRDPRSQLSWTRRAYRYLFADPRAYYRWRNTFYAIGPPLGYYLMRYWQGLPLNRLDAEDKLKQYQKYDSQNFPESKTVHRTVFLKLHSRLFIFFFWQMRKKPGFILYNYLIYFYMNLRHGLL